ncbi:MAG: CrcB family protein [Ktedonobacterales bacterium]|nr:CrcB family protein [Ktedonobacterales bacterium]
MTLSFALVLKALATGLGGALGAGTRHGIATAARLRFGDRFPWGTLAINLTGALAIGLFSALALRHQPLAAWHAPLVLGFLGGYTTFSTFLLEVARLRARAAHIPGALYLAISLIAGPLCAFIGLWLGGR